MEEKERIDKLEEARDQIVEEISIALKQHSARNMLDWLVVLRELDARIEKDK